MDNRIILGEYRQLERALWREIERLKKDEALTPAVVVAPSGRLVRRLKITAARRFPSGLVGVRFAHLFQFALDLAGADFRPNPILAERALLRWLKKNPIASPQTYDLAGALRGAIRDLKDAAVAPEPGVLLERLRDAVNEEAEGEYANRLTAYDIRKFGDLLAAYVHHEEELRRLKVDDLPDVFRLAAEHADRADAPLLVYGFYDLTQVQADFIKAVAARTPVTFFIPNGEGPTWKFGEWFAKTFAPMIAPAMERLEPEPLLVPEIHNAAGERDEVHGCAKEIRRLLDSGVPAGDIAIVARSLEAHLPHVEDIFREHRIPIDALPGRPLGEHPLAKAVRLLFRAPLDDFARSTLLEVLLHPLFKAQGDRRGWDHLARALRIGRGSDWDRLKKFSRKAYRIHSGRESDEDSRELVIPAAQVRALRKAAESITQARRPKSGGWKKMADAHFRLLGAFDRKSANDGEHAVLGEIEAVLGGLGKLEVLDETITLAEFLEAFDRELDRKALPARSSNGVAVLDAMGARGLSFPFVFAVGLNARAFPRFIVEEPFISDPVRRHVLRVLGHHLPVRHDGYDEERLLFHLLQSSATELFVCFYQRADADGRQKDPSPFLRPYIKNRAEIPAVPRGLRAKLAKEDLLTPNERILVTRDPAKWLAAFGRDTETFRRAQAVLEKLDANPLSDFEGLVGEAGKFDRLSPTRLERYAACPFRHFAEDVLRIFPYPEAEEGDDLTPMEIGNLQHLILEKLYRNLAAAGFRTRDLDKEVARAAKQASREFEARHTLALEGLLAARRDQAARFVRTFAEWDLSQLADWTPVDFEQRVTGEFAGVRFTGKIDRCDENPKGKRRVIDYKRKMSSAWTGTISTGAKRGQKLQPPLYIELSGADEAVFFFLQDYSWQDPALEEPKLTFTKEEWKNLRPDVTKTVRTLVRSMREGLFFIRPKEGQYGHCSNCDYSAVCRKSYRGLAAKAENSGADYWTTVNQKARS